MFIDFSMANKCSFKKYFIKGIFRYSYSFAGLRMAKIKGVSYSSRKHDILASKCFKCIEGKIANIIAL